MFGYLGGPPPVDPLIGNHDCDSARELVPGTYEQLVVTASQPDYFRVRIDPLASAYLRVAVVDSSHDFRVEVLDACNPVDGSLRPIYYDDVELEIQNTDSEPIVRSVRLYRDVGAIATYDPAVYDLTVSSLPDTPYPEHCHGASDMFDCPCGNTPEAPGGCEHSGGYGALLSVSGSQYDELGGLRVVARGLPSSAPAMLLSARLDANPPGLHFGDGYLCAGGGGMLRLDAGAANAAGSVTWSSDLDVGARREPGERIVVQVWYRDSEMSPCATRTNFTQGVELRVLPR